MTRRIGRLLGLVLAVAAALPAAAEAQQAQNLELLGNSDLGGRGRNGEVAVVGNTAIVGAGLIPDFLLTPYNHFYSPYSCAGQQVKVVDLSTPSAPRVASTIQTPGGTTAIDVAALRVSTPSFTGDLAAVALFRCSDVAEFVDRGVVYYDVTNPAEPRFLGRYDADANLETPEHPPCGEPRPPFSGGERCAGSQLSVHLTQRADGRVLSLSTQPLASAFNRPSGDLRVVDVTNPGNPTEVGSFPNGAERPPALPGRTGARSARSRNGCRNYFVGRGAEAGSGGTLGLLPFMDHGMLTVDLSNPADPNQLGHLAYPRDERTFEGNAAFVTEASVGGRALALLSNEDWVGPVTTLRLSSPASLAGSRFGCEAHFTLFDPEDTAQIYRKPGSQVSGEIVYVGRGCPTDRYLADPSGKIALIDSNLFFACQPDRQVERAQKAGAVGVTSRHDTTGPVIEATSNLADPTGPPIRAMSIDTPDGNELRQALCPARDAAGDCTGGGPVSGAMVDSPGEWGSLRVVDVTNPSSPSAVGEYRPPRAGVFPPPDLGVYSVHHAVARGSEAYVAANSDGLRVLDLSGGGSPRELASFVPRDTADPSPGGLKIPSKALVQGVAPGPQGTIVITDVNSGLYVLGRRGAPRGPAARISARVPRACASRSFRSRVRVSSSSRVTRVTVALDGRRIRTSRRGSFTVRVPVNRLRPGRHRLRIVATDAAGNRTARTVRFRVCASRRGPRFTG